MAHRFLSLVLLLLKYDVVAQTTCSDNLNRQSFQKLIVAPGFRARLVTNNVISPRGMVFDKDDNLLVVEKGVGISALKLKDDGGACVSVATKSSARADTKLNHGIQLTADGQTIFASSNAMVYSIAYNSAAMKTTGTPTTWITGMTGTDHTTRTLLLSKKVPGLMLVSRGSGKNMDWRTIDEKSGFSQIRIFNITAAGTTPKTYTDGTVLGWGLRNSIGMDEHPLTGGIWSNENASDDLYRDGTDVHEETPGEEVNFHGYLDGTPSGLKSKKYGYPYCASAWGLDAKFPDPRNPSAKVGFPRKEGLAVGKQFFLGNSAGVIEFKDSAISATTTKYQVPEKMSDEVCADPTKYTPPRLSLPSHWAPIDMRFNSKGTIAYMTSRGSWDKGSSFTFPRVENASGYKVFAVLFGDKGEPVEKPESRTAAISLLSNENEKACAHAGWTPGSKANCITPTGIALDKKGRLYVASEQTNEIFVITKKDGSSMDAVVEDLKQAQSAEYGGATRSAPRILSVRRESSWGTLWKMFGALEV